MTAIWKTFTVSVDELADALTALERTHPPLSDPIVVYIDITRVLVLWRHATPEAP